MIDLTKTFKNSWNLLAHNKAIPLPVMLSSLIPLFIFLVFLVSSGLFGYMAGYSKLLTEYSQTPEYMNAVNSTQATALMENYLEQNGYSDVPGRIFTPENIIIVITLAIIATILSVYLSCMSYVIVARAIKRQDNSMKSLFQSTNQFILRYLAINFFIVCIVILVPMVIYMAIIAASAFLNQVVAIIASVIGALAFIAYIVLAGLRLLFVEQSLFLDGKGAIESIKSSIKITKGRLWNSFLTGLIVFGIMFAVGILLGEPERQASMAILSSSPFLIALGCLLYLVFFIIRAVGFAFSNIFLFYAYLNFKK
jgi:hypothetical protein